MKDTRILFLLIPIFILFSSCHRQLSPQVSQKPAMAQTEFKLDSLPDSEINIPIQINLKPLYSLAEKNIDTVYTSPRYPNDWIQDGCGVRYKYHFSRGPLKITTIGTVMNLGFTGYYQVIGSTRACAGNAVLSPWTPPCHCGFDEGARRVQVNFSNSFFVTPDYKIKLAIQRQEPKAIDKCQVCFWGQDITAQVMNGLKAQLDTAKMTIEKNHGTIDLKKRFQQVWDNLNQVYSVYGLGWLQINPQKLRINNIYAKNDSLNVSIGLSARPVIGFEKPQSSQSNVPNLGDFPYHPGFNIFLDAKLDYDSLSTIVNAQLKGKEFDFDKGPLKKTVIVNNCKFAGENNEKLVIGVDFSGSYNGLAYFTGKPVYNDQSKTIEIQDLDFDLKTKDVLLRTARWLFNRRIINELKKYARFELDNYINAAKAQIGAQLNRELTKGVNSLGQIDDIKLIGIYPLSKDLVIRSNCSGRLSVIVDSIQFGF